MPAPPPAPPQVTTQPAPPPAPPQVTTQPSVQSGAAWGAIISRTPVPKKGCFKSSYPSTVWQEVPCTPAPQRPYPPTPTLRPDTVGKNPHGDFAALRLGFISSVVGSFDSVTGVTNENDSGKADTFSLQLNTNTFHTSICNNAAD